MGERRNSARNRTYLAGVIAFNGRASTMGCIVRNMSSGGARLNFCQGRALPDRFELTITRKDRSYQAQVAWRGADEVGVEFRNNDAAVPLEWQRRMRKMGTENAGLRRRLATLSEGY